MRSMFSWLSPPPAKGTTSVAEYLTKMQSLGNDMATAGRSLNDENLVQYILGGLDEDYNLVVNFVLARPQPISVSKFASHMLAFESSVDLCVGGYGSSANFTRRWRNDFGRSARRVRSGRGGRPPNSGGRGDHMTGARQGGRGNNNSE
jgi:hypothetical protein